MKPTFRQLLGLTVIFAVSGPYAVFANPADTDYNNEYDTKAELNGDRAFQDYAPEYLEIKILAMQVNMENDLFNQGKSLVKIQAEVRQSYRSATGLKSGQRILINYERKNSAGFGDTQPTVPKEGSVTAAFLRKDKDESFYVPAAQQYTFAPLTAAQMSRLNPRKKLLISGLDETPAPDAQTQPAPAGDIQLRQEDSPQSPKPAAEDALPSR
ncbi:MAG: hypothetical protein LBH01_00865 [Verrucomicrobiales bacterium]|jgi:hypothetical protein|nr:hypothetical protein [Verrucomicrobiales bacterium]